MMDLCHPTNFKFTLFHLIDKSGQEPCHILTILKSAESYAHAMILALLPYLLQKQSKKFEEEAAVIAKWFKPATQAQVADAYWDPKDKCIKNTSNKMLAQVSTKMVGLYWISNFPPLSPKWKWNQAEDK